MKEIIRDNESYGVSKPTICIVEIMGRHAGWLTAAAAMSRDIDCSGPDLIYLPEVPFDIKDFIKRIKALAKNKKSIVVAVSEGLQDKNGKFICEQGTVNDHVDAFGHKQLAGTAAYLANVVTQETGLKSRYIEFSSLQRCAAHLASRIDSDEAYNVGFLAAKAAFEGKSGMMVTIGVEQREPYVETYDLFDVHEVANIERKVPLNWITNDGTYVSDEYLAYARPFIIGSVQAYTAAGLPIHITMNKKKR
jgi:6-phosphofructokinase 1